MIVESVKEKGNLEGAKGRIRVIIYRPVSLYILPTKCWTEFLMQDRSGEGKS